MTDNTIHTLEAIHLERRVKSLQDLQAGRIHNQKYIYFVNYIDQNGSLGLLIIPLIT